jgi:hypothetical protein
MKSVVVASLLAFSVLTSWAAKPDDKPGKGGDVSSEHVSDNAFSNANANAAFQPVSNVPEAETVLLAVAGLVIVGVVAIRRRNQKK